MLQVTRFLALLIVLPSFTYAQQVSMKIDSIAFRINNSTNQYEQGLEIERCLTKIIDEAPESFTELRERINVVKLSSRNLLLLESYNARKLLMLGDLKELKEINSEGNPFIHFFKGSAEFYLANDSLSMHYYREGIRSFKRLKDTIYLASSYNNVGTLHWHADNLDSALIYFQKAKRYTYWHNRMLENNILAISNTLSDLELSKKQIEIIKENLTDDDLDPYFLTNALNYYNQCDPVSADSLSQFLRKTYMKFSEVPVQLMSIFIENKWIIDSVAPVLLETNPNSFLDDAIGGLVKSDLIASRQFSTAVLKDLARLTSSENDSILLMTFSKLDSTNRSDLANTLNDLDSEQRLEALKKLKSTAKGFEITIAEKENKFKRYIKVGTIGMFFGLLVIIFSQFRRIQQVRKSAKLSQLNAELAEKNNSIQKEVEKVRSGIEDLTSTSIKRIKELKIAVEGLDKNQKQSKALFSDLNIIVTHEEGLMRFRLKEVANKISAPHFEHLRKFLNEKEILILKLSILNFRSKEIASLLVVSPQHINNSRSKIKSTLEAELKVNYEEYIREIENSLFHVS